MFVVVVLTQVSLLLTNSMSATIDQHKFNETSAKNTKVKHQKPFVRANTSAINTIGADMNSPHAQIIGSHF